MAVPFVVTVLGPTACAERVYMNPQPPTSVPTTDVDAATTAETPVTDTPVAAADAGAAQGLPEPPNDGSGHLVVAENGDCLWEFNRSEMHCPPHAYCNPGPPRQPLHVKCPDGSKPPKR